MLELKNNLDIINEIKHICELNAFSLKILVLNKLRFMYDLSTMVFEHSIH